MAAMLHEAQATCPTCNGSGVLSEPVEERFEGFIDGPAPAARTWLIHVKGASGLSIDEVKAPHLFSERFKIRERDALRDMEDGLLMEHVARLRRILVMADEDRLPDWYVVLIRQRHDMAAEDLRWRRRAGEKGADRVAADIAWRERVDRLRGAIDLGSLIAYECDKARLVGSSKWECCCPFHADSSPSLSIDVTKGVWFCHGCQTGGDAFTYVELRYGLDFAAAVRHLEGRV